MRTWMLLPLCASCALDSDIIATPHSIDVDGGVANSVRVDAGAPCSNVDERLLVTDSEGELTRVSADADMVASETSTADCLANGALSTTVDRYGTLWSIGLDGRTWMAAPFAECSQVTIAENLRSWTSAYRPELTAERLYALQNDSLLVIDPRSLTISARFSTAPARWLVGNAEGMLYGIEPDGTWIVLSKINPDDGSSVPKLKLAYAEDSEPTAATLWRGQLILAFGKNLYAYDFGKSAPTMLLSLPADHATVDALAASSCASTK